jgi:hypothetical protein
MAYKQQLKTLKEKQKPYFISEPYGLPRELQEKDKYKTTAKEKKYDRYYDPAHSWVKVKVSELKTLGIADKVSPYSYRRGKYVYLEEDSDMSLFYNAKEKKGEKFAFREHISDKSSKIRSYSPYKVQTEEQEKETEELRQQILNSPTHDWSKKAIRKIKNASKSDLEYWKTH